MTDQPTPDPADGPLRQRIADAIHRNRFPSSNWDRQPEFVRADYLDIADAVLAVVQPELDRLRRLAIDRADRIDDINFARATLRKRIAEQEEETMRQHERAKEAEAELAKIRATLGEVLRDFVHKGHPGEPCLQTGWISEKTVARWRAALQPPAPAHDDAPTVSDWERERQRADQLASALRQVLAALYAITRLGDPTPLGYQAIHPIAPADYARWSAALQPAPAATEATEPESTPADEGRLDREYWTRKHDA